MFGQLIKYSMFYGGTIPENPLSLIYGIPKEELIVTISAINSRLKPIYSPDFDNSRRTQVSCLKAVFLDDRNTLQNSNCLPIFRKFMRIPENFFLFSRVSCLFALQEIIASENFTSEIPQYNFDNRENIFKYLLIINERILLFDNQYRENEHKELDELFFEYFMFKELHHSQYEDTFNSLNAFYKSKYLFNCLSTSNVYSMHLSRYLVWMYGTDDLDCFFKHHILTYFKSLDDNLGLCYINVAGQETEAIEILDRLSYRTEIPLGEDLDYFDFLQLKKGPLYKSNVTEDDLHTYIVLDNIFLFEKLYSIFINDFWFDYLSPNEVCTRKDWGNFIGSIFFEPFLNELFIRSFQNSPDIIYRSVDELKFSYEGSSIEYADFYIREKQNVLIAEAKSNYLPNIDGYKTVNTVDDYKALDMDKFYETYGLTQLVKKTIKKFHSYKIHIDDPQFNQTRKVQIYPVLIVNDQIFTSTASVFAFRNRFDRMLAEENIQSKTKEHNIKPLVIIHVSELQEIEESLNNRNLSLFNLLDYYYQLTDPSNPVNHRDMNFLRTFRFVIDRKISQRDQIPERVRSIEWLGE